MIDPNQLDQITDRLMNLLPQGVREVQQDIEKNLRSVLQTSFTKLDLVTREEFDVQAAVLAKTREKLEALEKQIAELEAKLGKN